MTTSLDALKSLATIFSGNKATRTLSGGSETQTTSTDIDQETLNKLLQSALESNSGLATTAQGQKTAGLYNSSTSKLLTNDLVSRLTAQVAAGTATKTTTTTKTPVKEVTQGGGLGQTDTLTKLVAGLSAIDKLGGIKGIKSGLKSTLDELGGFFESSNGNFLANIQDQGFSTMPSGLDSIPTQGMSVAPSANFSSANYSFLDALSNPVTDSLSYAPIDLTAGQVDLSNSGGAQPNFSQASSKIGDTSPVYEGAVKAAGSTNLSALTAPTVNAWSSGMAALGLVQGLEGLMDGDGSNDLLATVGTGISGYQVYQAASALANGGSLSFAAPKAAASTSLISDVLPYAGSILAAAQGDVQNAALSAAGTYVGGTIGGPPGAAIGAFIGSTLSSIFDGPADDPHNNADYTAYRLGTGKSGAFGTALPEFGVDPEYTRLFRAYANAVDREPYLSDYNYADVYTGEKSRYVRPEEPDPTKYYKPDYFVAGDTSGSGRWTDSYALDQTTIDAYNKYAARTFEAAQHFGKAFSTDTSYLDNVTASGNYATLDDALTAYHDSLFAAVKDNSGAFKNYI